MESNQRIVVLQATLLPLEYRDIERVEGIEPSLSAWKAVILPLDDTRVIPQNSGESGTRTRRALRPYLHSKQAPFHSDPLQIVNLYGVPGMELATCLCGHPWAHHFNESTGRNPKRCAICSCDRYCNSAPPSEGDTDLLNDLVREQGIEPR